jgi:hypothetical protein
LKGLVKKILDKANLEEVTMKTVVKQVSELLDIDLDGAKVIQLTALEFLLNFTVL